MDATITAGCGEPYISQCFIQFTNLVKVALRGSSYVGMYQYYVAKVVLYC